MKKNGFTLIEMAVVLTILGLLVGGIIAGQSLLRSSGLRSVMTEAETFKTSAIIFQQKYDEIPGDMEDATVIWGSSPSCPGTAGTGKQTCNGNGDGEVRSGGTIGHYNEQFQFWQHLANEGLIEGAYTGRTGPGRNDNAVGGVNVPRSSLDSQAVWQAETHHNNGSVLQFTMADTTNFLRIGGETVNWNNGAILTIEEAWNIDKKMDDGHATRGKVWAVRWNSCTPATSGTDYQDYDLGVTGKQCGLMFLDAF